MDLDQNENPDIKPAMEKALALLARCEQNRQGLYTKLIQKKYDKIAVTAVLDYLEERGLLSDERFARLWLSARRISKPEGRQRLLAELAARGIKKEVAKAAVDAFFAENDEEGLCERAAKKFIRQKITGEKLKAALLRSGFSFKIIKKVLDKNGDF